MVLILKHRLQFDFKADESNKFKQKIISFKYRSFLFFVSIEFPARQIHFSSLKLDFINMPLGSCIFLNDISMENNYDTSEI